MTELYIFKRKVWGAGYLHREYDLRGWRKTPLDPKMSISAGTKNRDSTIRDLFIWMNHGPLLKCTYPWECSHIQNTQLDIPQHKLLHMTLSMGHKFKAHEKKILRWKRKPKAASSFERAGLVRDGGGTPGQRAQWEGAELGGHREGRDRGEGVSEREVQRPLDAETSLPTAQPPQMAHPRCNSP